MKICFYSQYKNLISYLDFWDVSIVNTLESVYVQNYDLLIADTSCLTEETLSTVNRPVIGLAESLENTNFFYKFDRILTTPCNPLYLIFNINHVLNQFKYHNKLLTRTIEKDNTISLLNQIPLMKSEESIKVMETLYSRKLLLNETTNHHTLQAVAIVSELHANGTMIWTDRSEQGNVTLKIDSKDLINNSPYIKLASSYGLRLIYDPYCTYSTYELTTNHLK